MPSKIRDILNRIKWDPQLNEGKFLLTFIHRGAPGNIKIIEVKSIKVISENFFSYFDNNNYNFIPFHRILIIREKETNQILYKKK